jgi:choline kinase
MTPTLSSKTTLVVPSGDEGSSSQNQESNHQLAHRKHRHHVSERLLAQVGEWLEHERKKAGQKRMPFAHRTPHEDGHAAQTPEAAERDVRHHYRSDSLDSQSSEVSLDRLQRILEDNMAALGLSTMPHLSPGLGRRRSSAHLRRHGARQLMRSASSDTDYLDGDVVVPSCDAVLDNSKTMSYSGGFASTDDLPALISKREEKDRQSWLVFKNEIIRLAHTLKLKGWRSVPLEAGDTISVERLSGALTNAVYVATPPEGPPVAADSSTAEGGGGARKAPGKILLRIYGPNVEHLINRDEELAVLKRLARKKIGPRLLGTFSNGRFEEYFNASALKPHDLREPETSKQIAKRMRELHDGVELLREEREAGPAVFKNWDRWLDNVERVVTKLDERVRAGEEAKGSRDAWLERGYVCGVEWSVFKAMVQRHRDFIVSYYGGMEAIKEALVFGHNDVCFQFPFRYRPQPAFLTGHRHNTAISSVSAPTTQRALSSNPPTSTSNSSSSTSSTRRPTHPASNSPTTSASGATTTTTPGRRTSAGTIGTRRPRSSTASCGRTWTTARSSRWRARRRG